MQLTYLRCHLKFQYLYRKIDLIRKGPEIQKDILIKKFVFPV